MKKAIEGRRIRFTFDGLEDLTFNSNIVHVDVCTHAIMHGFLQRLGDAAAIPRQDSKGNVVLVTEAMRREAVAELIQHYESGSPEWNLKARAARKTQSPVILDIAAKRGISYEEAEALIADQFLGELAS